MSGIGKKILWLTVAVIAGIVVAAAFGGCSLFVKNSGSGNEGPGGQGKEVAAMVNGARIYFNDVNQEYNALTPSQQANVTKADALSFLIEREILYQEAVKEGLKATNKEFDEEYQQFLKANNLTEPELEAQLAARNSSIEKLKLSLKKQLPINKLFDKKIPSQFLIKHEEVEAVYNSSRLNTAGVSFRQAEQSIIEMLTAQRKKAEREKYILALKDKSDVVIVAVPS